MFYDAYFVVGYNFIVTGELNTTSVCRKAPVVSKLKIAVCAAHPRTVVRLIPCQFT